jgi:hypothetical protein
MTFIHDADFVPYSYARDDGGGRTRTLGMVTRPFANASPDVMTWTSHPFHHVESAQICRMQDMMQVAVLAQEKMEIQWQDTFSNIGTAALSINAANGTLS